MQVLRCTSPKVALLGMPVTWIMWVGLWDFGSFCPCEEILVWSDSCGAELQCSASLKSAVYFSLLSIQIPVHCVFHSSLRKIIILYIPQEILVYTCMYIYVWIVLFQSCSEVCMKVTKSSVIPCFFFLSFCLLTDLFQCSLQVKWFMLVLNGQYQKYQCCEY